MLPKESRSVITFCDHRTTSFDLLWKFPSNKHKILHLFENEMKILLSVLILSIKHQYTNAPVIWNCCTPPILALAGDCGDSHLIYTSFWYPVEGELAWSHGLRIPNRVNLSRSMNEITSTIKIFWHTHWGAFASYLLATQRLICLLHGFHVLRLAIISCFTKQVPCIKE